MNKLSKCIGLLRVLNLVNLDYNMCTIFRHLYKAGTSSSLILPEKEGKEL